MKRSEVIAKIAEVVATPAAPAVVFRNDRREVTREAVDEQLKTSGEGQVFVIDPIAGVTARDVVKRGGVSGAASIICHLRTNMVTKPAAVTVDNIQDQLDRIVNSVLAAQIGASVSGEYLNEIPDDLGLVTYQLIFTVTTESSIQKD